MTNCIVCGDFVVSGAGFHPDCALEMPELCAAYVPPLIKHKDQFEALRSTANQEWETPSHIFQPLHNEFQFTVDGCASQKNTKLPRFWDEQMDSLKQDWSSERVFCNPPYGKHQRAFIEKAAQSKSLAVLLIPARTDTRAWHDHIHGKAELRFIKGRIQFVGATNYAPFASCIVIFNGD